MLGITDVSDQLLLIDHQLELQPQLLGRLAAKNHPLHKNFKIVHHRAVLGIYGQLQLNQGMFFVDLQLRLLYGVVYPVMDIKGAGVLIPDPAAAHI